MSLLYDEGQQAIATEATRVLEARHKPENLLALLERQGEYDQNYWETCKEQGWTGIALPENVGGLNLTLIELGLVAKAAGAVCCGAPFLTSSFGAARAILAYGSDTLKASWLGRLASGEAIGVVAFSEGQAILPSHPKLRFANGKLTGTQSFVSGGAHGAVAVVLASENEAPVLVVAPIENVERQCLNTFDNSRCIADLAFVDTPAEVLLRGPDVLTAVRHILALQAVITAHEQVGGAEALMLQARDYANTRRAFGSPIGAFQAVKHKIAELYALIELARANAIHAASCEGQADFLKAAAAARLSATEAYDTAARDCVQIHGGIGVTWEAGLHLHQRRARTLAIDQGNSLFWEDILADELMGVAA